MANPDTKKLTVYFDGACPLCRREIGFYQRQDGADAIDWLDVSSGARDLGSDLSCEAALKRFHVRTPNGDLMSGARGFAALWRALPKFSLVGRLAALPGVVHIAEFLYRVFLKIRPAMQAGARRLESPATGTNSST
ncbi:MAG: DUF393 domain-containing protein [Pseudomonadota bacterium]